jgi:hypothetical protein
MTGCAEPIVSSPAYDFAEACFRSEVLKCSDDRLAAALGSTVIGAMSSALIERLGRAAVKEIMRAVLIDAEIA